MNHYQSQRRVFNHLLYQVGWVGIVLAGVTFGIIDAVVADVLFASSNELVLETAPDCSVWAISLRGHGGEENWSSIRVLKDGSVLVGLSSRSASAVLVRVNVDTRTVARVLPMDTAGHLAPLQRQPKIHVNPVSDGTNGWWFVSHGGNETHLPLYGSRLGYEGMHLWRWMETDVVAPTGMGSTGRVEHHGLVFPGDGAVALAGSQRGDVLYAVTFPRAELLRIQPGTAVDCRFNSTANSEVTFGTRPQEDSPKKSGDCSGKVENLGRINGVYAPRQILMDSVDRPYVLDHTARFWTLASDRSGLVPTPYRLTLDDSLPGNLLAQGLVSAVSDETRNIWYGVSAWGHFYRIQLGGAADIRVDDLGLPAQVISEQTLLPSSRRQVTIAGLVRGPDQRFYMAISGFNKAIDGHGDSYILRCDEKGQNVERIARLNGKQVPYICGSGAVDPQRRRIFFVASHLVQDMPYLFVVEPKE